MAGIKITEKDGPDVLKPAIVTTPVPGPGQVLVKAAAAGVNRPDVQRRAGAYPSRSTYPLALAAVALKRTETSQHIGKIVLVVSSWRWRSVSLALGKRAGAS